MVLVTLFTDCQTVLLGWRSLTFFEDFVRLLAGRLTGEDPALLADLGKRMRGTAKYVHAKKKLDCSVGRFSTFNIWR